MRKIFIFWIIFLIILAIGISLVISSKSALKKEEKRAEELRKAVISRPSRLPKLPAAGKIEVEQPKVEGESLPQPEERVSKETSGTAPAEPAPPTLGETSSPQDKIPVEINTNSLEISIPAPQSDNPLPESQSNQPPLVGQ